MTTSWRTREELVHLVVTLAKQATTRRASARALGVSRNTVRAVLEAHEVGRDAEQSALETRSSRAPRPTKIDPHKARIRELTGRYPDITAQRVYEILRDEGSDASYAGVKRYVRTLRPPPRPTPSLATPDYGPGEMSESDWSPYEVRFTGGKTATVHALSYVLVHSRRKYFGLYESNDLHALMDGHERAFTRFGACAAANWISPLAPNGSLLCARRRTVTFDLAHWLAGRQIDEPLVVVTIARTPVADARVSHREALGVGAFE